MDFCRGNIVTTTRLSITHPLTEQQTNDCVGKAEMLLKQIKRISIDKEMIETAVKLPNSGALED